MKKSILLIGLILYVGLLMAQNFAQLRFSDTDVSGLEPGDKVYISIEIDTISPGIDVLGWTMFFHVDDEVVTWDGTNSNPMPGITYINPLFPPVIIPPNVGINYFDGTFGWMWGGSANLDGQNFPVTVVTLKFTYQGGETPILWDNQTTIWGGIEPLELTLVNGCVCDFNDVTFHVTSVYGDLEGAEVTVGDESATTNSSGIAVFDLPDGDYTYTVTKYGFADEEGTFTVAGEPQLIEVELEECWDVFLHLLGPYGAITDSALVIVNNDTVWTTNGSAAFCTTVPTINYEVYVEGYYPSIGSFILAEPGMTINIIMAPILCNITFFANCCGEPLADIQIIINAVTIITGPSGMVVFDLPAGTYFYTASSYTAGSIEGTVTIPPPAYIDLDFCGEVTFHVTTEQGYPLNNVLIEVDGSSLVTDFNGEADTCLQVGSYNYSASKPGFINQTGTIEMDTIPQTVEIVMPPETWGITIHVIGFECDNEFEELVIITNGDTVSVGQPIYLENGSYNFEVAILGCPSLVTGNFEVDNAPQTVQVILNDFPKAYFYVLWDDIPVYNTAIILDDEDTLYTNELGNAVFCVSGGNHSVFVPEYYINEVFTFDCINSYYGWLVAGTNELGFQFNSFDIYPNPSFGKFSIENLNQTGEPTEIFVTDITGSVVYQTITSNLDKTEIDLSDQPKGMYFVRVKAGEMVVNRKVIIQ